MQHEPDDPVDVLAKAAIGAALEVHRRLGPGYLESVYEEALAVELELRNISFRRQCPIHVCYKGCKVGEGRLDFLIADSLVIEIKSVEALAPVHVAQIISYLKTLNRPLGLLINFNVPLLKDGIRRIILSPPVTSSQ